MIIKYFVAMHVWMTMHNTIIDEHLQLQIETRIPEKKVMKL